MISLPDASPQNWGYWCEKYGPIRALKLYYPDTLRSEPEVADAARRLQQAEAEINAWFARQAGGKL